MFAEIEDRADRHDGDLSLLPVAFAPSLTARIKVRKAGKRATNRRKALLPGGVPRYVRCYDNGGKTIDRFTVVFSGRSAADHCGHVTQWPFLAMNSAPFHPQGFGQHGHSNNRPCDVDPWGFPPAMGRKNHLGRRIPFAELPEDCRKLALRDYCEIWNLKGGAL